MIQRKPFEIENWNLKFFDFEFVGQGKGGEILSQNCWDQMQNYNYDPVGWNDFSMNHESRLYILGWLTQHVY